MGYFSLLAVCGAVGAAGYFTRGRSPRLGAGLLIVAVAGFLGALGWQVFRSTAGDTPRALDRHSAALAYFIGHAAAAEVAAHPGPVAILLPRETSGNRTTLDSLFDTVARVLSPIPGVEIKEAPVAATATQMERGELSWREFTNALAGVPNPTAWISFVGLPKDQPSAGAFAARLPSRGYVYDPSAGTAWLEALKAGTVRRVVVPRPVGDPSESRPVSGPPDEIFRAHFLMVTAENADRMAAQLRSADPSR